MKDFLTVARWEFNRNVRNKAFIVSTLLFPVILLVAVLVPQLFLNNEGDQLVIVDQTNQLYAQMESILEGQGIETEEATGLTPADIKVRAEENKDKSYLYIPADFFDNHQVSYFFKASAGIDRQKLYLPLNQALQSHAIHSLGLSQSEIAQLQATATIERNIVDQEDHVNKESFAPTQLGLMVFGFLIVFSSMMAGGFLLQSIIKEKNDRVVEILLSSISSRALMGGKIVGSLLLGVVQMLVLVAFGFGIVRFGFNLNPLEMLSFNLFYSIIYGFLALILIFAFYALLGAIMKEIQSSGQAQPLLIVLPIAPMWFASAIISEPFGVLARILSFFPPTTPLTMMMRVAFVNVPAWEIILSITLLALFDLLMINFVARIFKTGLLMYGKGAGFKEAWKWFKQARA